MIVRRLCLVVAIACNEAAMKDAPAATKETMRKAFADAEKQTKDAWKNMDGAVMTKACETMIDALSANPTCPKQ